MFGADWDLCFCIGCVFNLVMIHFGENWRGTSRSLVDQLSLTLVTTWFTMHCGFSKWRGGRKRLERETSDDNNEDKGDCDGVCKVGQLPDCELNDVMMVLVRNVTAPP